MEWNHNYPLVNVHITMENPPMLLMGKSTISMVIFNSKLLVYQRVMVISWDIIWINWDSLRSFHPAIYGPFVEDFALKVWLFSMANC